jgi:hypothetical protein
MIWWEGGPIFSRNIDATTVHLLQSRAPGVSEQDLRFLRQKRRTLFKCIESQRERNNILERMEQIQVPIPTLKTFFQDVLFLDVGQSVMRNLCRNPLMGAQSIDEVLEEQYIVGAGVLSDPGLLPAALYDLWRFSLQFAFEMTTQKDHRRRVPRKRDDIERADRHHLHETSSRGWPRGSSSTSSDSRVTTGFFHPIPLTTHHPPQVSHHQSQSISPQNGTRM